MSYETAASSILAYLAAEPGVARLRELRPDVDFEPDVLAQIVNTAAHFARDVVMPFGDVADAVGCQFVDGRVRTPPGHAETWAAFCEGGWPAIELPEGHGGAGLPLVVHSGCEELFNRASPAFGMLATPTRCAAVLLDKHADQAIRDEWLPNLTSGKWTGTICISESDAGSDVGRIRTTARQDVGGKWRVTGEKMWISFGDHDFAERIGHMVLARTPDAPEGTRGLSLFLVPSVVDGAPNGVVPRRIEEKMGLHGSPTCVLGLEEAQAMLIGELNRGLAQLFTMIVRMRISVGSQGAAIAAAATDAAMGYAAERRQGGPTTAAVTIDRHGDVQRMLLGMAARAEVCRGLVLTTSTMADLAACEIDEDAANQARELLGWLLPITKNFCAESAFLVASEAIQVLGGAGYTREWPVERYLRDARVLSIYEGTTGMQALDLLHRRVLTKEASGLDAFLKAVKEDIEQAPNPGDAVQLGSAIDILNDASAILRERAACGDDCEASAYAYLQIASFVTAGWIALRMASLEGGDSEIRLAARGRAWLQMLRALIAKEYESLKSGAQILNLFEESK